MTPAALAELIRDKARGSPRFVVAIAGAPGSGKSTLAAAVRAALGAGARVVPMDGFHYDDAVLQARGLRSRKGAPETFDVAGFLHMLARLRGPESEIAIPIFDRGLEISRAAADVVARDDRILIVEGNYLLLNEDPWAQARNLFDLTVFLDVPVEELDRRLRERWKTHGMSPAKARNWIATNDMPNIRRVRSTSRPADLVVRPDLA